MEKMSKLTDLMNDLQSVYSDLRAGKIGLREAKEVNNTAGKIISGYKLKLEYNNFTKSQGTIGFLED